MDDGKLKWKKVILWIRRYSYIATRTFGKVIKCTWRYFTAFPLVQSSRYVYTSFPFLLPF